jgi:hypothetical protein
MISEKFDLKGLFGVFGVGSLLILGCFFILNGTIGIWDTMEEAAGLKGWNIFVSIPIVVVSYLFGIISIEMADLILYNKNIQVEENKTIKALIEIDNQFLQGIYIENLQTQRLLKGGFIAFIFIAVGTFLEANRWDTIGILGYTGSFGALGLSIFCMIINKRIRQKFQSTVILLKDSNGERHSV